jgi:hypothetical protein
LWLRAWRRNTSKEASIVQVGLFGHDALGLFDADAAVQRVLQLRLDGVGPVQFAMLEDPDGGHVGQRLHDRLGPG